MRVSIGFLCSASFLLADNAGGDPRAAALLALIPKAYSGLHAIHVAARKETTVSGKVSLLADSDYELAEKAGGKYFVESKDPNAIEIMASDGETTWKALPKAKKWTQMEAASDLSSPENTPDSMSADLHTTARSMFLGRYPALVKIATEPEFLKEEQLKVGKEKILCGVVRIKTEKVTHDLWIDEQRGFVLQDVQNGREEYRGVPVIVKITLRIKALDIDRDVDVDLFNFRPEPDWKEVEMLVVPGEKQVNLAGLRAADFHGKLLGGGSFDLSSLQGKVVVLDFWATWCGPCMRELPSIQKLRQDFAGKAEFMGINDEDSGTIKNFVKKHNSDMPILMDESRAVHKQYGVNAIPTLLIIGRDGVIREHFVGSRSEETLRSAIASAVGSAN